MTPPKWDIVKAIERLRVWETFAAQHGLHLGICGGVLHRGHSDKDLDVTVFPLGTNRAKSWRGLVSALETIGFSNFQERNHEKYGDEKTVIRSEYLGVRVDWFLLHVDQNT